MDGIAVHPAMWYPLAFAVALLAAAVWLPALLSPDRAYRRAAEVQDRLAAQARAEDAPDPEPMPAEAEDVLREEMARHGVVRVDEDSFRLVSTSVRATLDRLTTPIGGAQ